MHPNDATATTSHSIELACVQASQPPSTAIKAQRASDMTLRSDGRALQELSLAEDSTRITSKTSTAIVICCITYSTGISTFLSGVVTMALPVITVDLHLPNNLQLW